MDPPQLRQQIQKATVLFQSGRYDEAEALLLEIVKRTPLYANIYNMLGFIYSIPSAMSRRRLWNCSAKP